MLTMQNSVDIETYKESIIHGLEKRGMLDNIKANLRSNIYNSLKESLSKDHTGKSTKYIKEIDIDRVNLLKLAMSLMSDFMKKLSMQYSLSVFINECRSVIGCDFYSESDLLKLCNIKIEDFNACVDLYSSFLCYLIKFRLFPVSTTTYANVDCQTEPPEDTTISMEDKLKLVDEKYFGTLSYETLMPAKTIESKMIKYQQELNLKFQSDLELEVQRIKQLEISQVRVEENRKYLKKLDDIREEYEKEYKDKLDAIKRRENEFNIRMNQKEKDIERLLYQNSQKFQSELELLKMRDEEMKRKYENDFNNLNLEKEKLNFKTKETEYIRETSLKKINEQIEQFKLEYDRLFEIEKSEYRKKKLDADEKEFKNSLFVEKLEKTQKEYTELGATYTKLKQDYAMLSLNHDTLLNDLRNLREELKTATMNERRHTEMIAKSDLENGHLKEELKLLKESIEMYRKNADERKNEHLILIEDLKNQLSENMKRYEYGKEQLRIESEQSKKQYNNFIDKEKESYEAEMKKKIQQLEDNCHKYKDMYNKISKKLTDSTSSINFRTSPTPPDTVRFNFAQSNRRGIFAKLEKEQEDIKTELKRSFMALSTGKREEERYLLLPVKTTREEEIEIDRKIIQSHKDKQSTVKGYTDDIISLNQVIGHTFLPQTPMKASDFLAKGLTMGNSNNNNNNTVTKNNLVKSEDNILNYIPNTDTKRDALDSVKPKEEIQIQSNENKKLNDIDQIKEKDNLTGSIFKQEESVNSKILTKLQNTQNVEFEKKIQQDILEKEERENERKQFAQNNENYNYIQKEDEKVLPTPLIVSGTANSVRSNKELDKGDSNDLSIANITSDSHEWNMGSDKFDNNIAMKSEIKPKQDKLLESANILNNIFGTQKKEDTTPNKPKQEEKIEKYEKANPSKVYAEDHGKPMESKINKAKPAVNASIKEELEESNTENISNIIDNVIKKSESSNLDINKSSYNKFQTVDYEAKKEENENKSVDEEDDYGGDFVEDADADMLDKKGASLEFDVLKNASIGHITNTSYKAASKSGNKKSQSIDRQIDLLLQSKTSNIEENINEEISVETSKRDKKAKSGGTIEEESALKYNDFNASNKSGNSKNMKDSAKFESRNSEIKEEIVLEDDDGYDPVEY